MQEHDMYLHLLWSFFMSVKFYRPRHDQKIDKFKLAAFAKYLISGMVN